MKRDYRTYPEEFKLEALELYSTSGKSSAQIERELGITKGLLLKWRDKYEVYEEKGKKKLELNDAEALRRELLKTQRELSRVTEERDILKKAINIFSRKNE